MSSYTRCSSGPSAYMKARITQNIKQENYQKLSYIGTLQIDTVVCYVQGKGPARQYSSSSRGGTSNARPSQASFLTHLHEIILENYLCTLWYCNVGLWCMCGMPSASGSGRPGREVNAVYGMGHIKKRTLKVKSLPVSMLMSARFQRRLHACKCKIAPQDLRRVIEHTLKLNPKNGTNCG